jgi:SAM-dependent methyltransferase
MREVLAHRDVSSLFGNLEDQLVVEHERVPFPSFPYEWPAEMLHAAAVLTLDIAQEALQEGFGLKDGTPYNVLFKGPNPIFIDLLSFERRDPGDPTWLPYAQFVRTFLLPLLANKYLGLQLDQLLTTRRDGLEPEEVYRWLRPWQKLWRPFLSLVSMPTWLAARHNQDNTRMYQKKSLKDPEKARFILCSLLNRLRRTLNALTPERGKTSTWSDYMVSHSYTREQLRAKEAFVKQALAEFSTKRILDAGCNTGRFSALAARTGASVVAIDYDPVVVGEVWRNAHSEGLDTLPLVVNLARPTPGTGWRNQECSPFLDRAKGRFDAVLMLALIHHLLVTERIPLPDILNLASDLTTDLLIIEFIAPTDGMFRRITRGRDHLHADLNVGLFEAACCRHFEVVRSQHLEGSSRWLYLLRKKR